MRDGICGHNDGIIRKCSNNTKIISYANGGGMSGINGGTIEECYNSGVIEVAYHAGGISGVNVFTKNDIIIQNCYNIGSISTIGMDNQQSAATGGIVGNVQNESIIQNCYNTGSITTTLEQTNAGGIIGKNIENEKQVVQNVYNTGTIKIGNVEAIDNIGIIEPFIGKLIGRYGTLKGNYGNIEVDIMKDWNADTILENLGSSFKENINDNINNGLPILYWQ